MNIAENALIRQGHSRICQKSQKTLHLELPGISFSRALSSEYWLAFVQAGLIHTCPTSDNPTSPQHITPDQPLLPTNPPLPSPLQPNPAQPDPIQTTRPPPLHRTYYTQGLLGGSRPGDVPQPPGSNPRANPAGGELSGRALWREGASSSQHPRILLRQRNATLGCIDPTYDRARWRFDDAAPRKSQGPCVGASTQRGLFPLLNHPGGVPSAVPSIADPCKFVKAEGSSLNELH